VDDGTCFVGTGGLYDDDPAGSILAVDPDGSVRWRKEPGQQSASVVAVDGGVVYAVTGDTSGPHGSNFRLHAYGADGGERRWVWAPERHSTFLQFIGVGEESVFVGTHDDNLEDSGETLVAVDLTDGVPAWERDVGDVRGGALTDGTVVAAGSRRLSAFAIAEGSTRWTDEYESDRHVDPTGFGDVVLVGEGTVRALDAVDGTERWTVGDGAVNYVHVAGETAYVGGTTVAALDADGRTDWTYEKPATLSAVVLTEATLFGSSEGALFALAPSDGTEQWRVDVDAEFVAPGAVAHGRLASLTREGNVLAVDARDGSEAWSWQTPARLTRPVAAGGRVVVGREGGGLWGLEP
jgi:outer membrane protein assembly factor BamB